MAVSYYRTFDLISSDLFPSNWVTQVARLAERRARFVHMDGNSCDCREPEGTAGTSYSVVTGDEICKELPWLYDLYTGHLLNLAMQTAEARLTYCNTVRAGVNINMLKGMGSRYEWHIDPNPLTGILFVTSHPKGGRLVLKGNGSLTEIEPVAGRFLLFDGRRVPHCVSELQEDGPRITVPMLYYYADESQIWPKELDAYLYGLPNS